MLRLRRLLGSANGSRLAWLEKSRITAPSLSFRWPSPCKSSSREPSLKKFGLCTGSVAWLSEVKRRERRLGAIMFTDVVAYTSMTEKDENAALRLLEEHRTLLNEIFPKYEGNAVKTIGDAFLVEFASAGQAVNCALEAQAEMQKFNETRPPNEKVMIRVAIHVGDFVHSAGDVLGGAVNVASRVQQFAEPGGICVTRQVVDQV